jgi:hypothetical protein
VKRLELPDGQWADLIEKPKHADYVAIVEAAEEAARGTGSWVLWAETVGRRFCKAWLVRGDDGQPLDVNDWSNADPDITDAICTEAQNRWGEWEANRVPLVTRRPRPKNRSGTSTPSDAGPEGSPSPSPT